MSTEDKILLRRAITMGTDTAIAQGALDSAALAHAFALDHQGNAAPTPDDLMGYLVSTWAPRAARQALKAIRERIVDGHLTLRCNLDTDDVEAMIEHGCGDRWTIEEPGSQATSEPGHQAQVVVPISAIDWMATIAQYCDPVRDDILNVALKDDVDLTLVLDCLVADERYSAPTFH